MNAIKSLLQNVVNVKTHSTEITKSTETTTTINSGTNIDHDEGQATSTTTSLPLALVNVAEPQKMLFQIKANNDVECTTLQETVFDLIRGIIDPEKPQTLEDLDVVKEEDVYVYRHEEDFWIRLEFTPTVPHCSLASLIGLCLRSKLEINLPDKHKLDIYIKEGTHSTAEEINKQINDKERIAAAMENPNLRDLVNKCISDDG